MKEGYRRNVKKSLEYYMQWALRDIQIFLQSIAKITDAYDLPHLVDTLHGNSDNTKKF